MAEDGAAARQDVPELAGLPGGAKAALEAVLMVIDEPATEADFAEVLGLPADQVRRLLLDLQADYDGRGGAGAVPRGFELRSIAGGWRIFSRGDFAPVVSRFVREGQTARLTQAAMETLAVIAYRQPVARARISAIRGVNVDSVVRTLLQRGLITEAGTDPETGAVLYRTTQYFLERLGIGNLAELPELAPHLPGLEHLGDFDHLMP